MKDREVEFGEFYVVVSVVECGGSEEVFFVFVNGDGLYIFFYCLKCIGIFILLVILDG